MNLIPERLPTAVVGDQPPLPRQQRRAAKRRADKEAKRHNHLPLLPKHTTIKDDQTALALEAFRITREKYGRHLLSDEHQRALLYIATRMTQMATGDIHKEFSTDTIRLAYGLQCGGGKTLSAKAWIAAVSKLKKTYSVVYTANEVEALCDVKRDLIKNFGVPENAIGLLHRMGDKASLPATPDDELHTKQFLLCSHNMVRTGEKNLDLYNTYHGKPRDLVIYDESLIISDTWSVKNKWIKAGLDHLQREIEFEGKTHLTVIHQYVRDTLDAFLAEADAQRDTGKLPETITVPELTNYAEDLHPDAAKRLLPTGTPGSIHTLLDATGRDVRVITEGSRGIAWFHAKVPEELKSVFVLDASHLIRDLSRLEGTNIVEDKKQRDPGITFEDLTIDYFKTPAGYGSIARECRQPLKERKLVKKLATWINSRPEGEKVNVWTFKQRDPKLNILDELRAGLARHRVNLDHINFLTHGTAKGSNRFAEAPHTAFYGVFEQDKLNFAGQMIGQSKDLLADLQRLDQVHKSEVLHDVFQEIARSGIRKINQGRGGQGTVFFPCWHVEDVSEKLSDPKVFRGATLVHRSDLEDQPKLPAEPAKYELVARSITAALADLDPDAPSIGATKLKPLVSKRVGFEVTERVWKDALRDLAPYREEPDAPTSLSDVGWKKGPRGFLRMTAEEYGF